MGKYSHLKLRHRKITRSIASICNVRINTIAEHSMGYVYPFLISHG